MSSARDDLVQLLTLTAHEMRGPLSVAAGYMKMLATERQGPLNEAQRKSVDAAVRACEQLAALASDVSAVARLERGETELSRVVVSAVALVDEIIAGCAMPDHHPVTFESTGDVEAWILVDPIRARQSLRALLMSVGRSVQEGAVILVRRLVCTEGTQRNLLLVIAEAGRASEDAAKGFAERPALAEWEGGLGLAVPLATGLLRLEGGDVRTLDASAPGLVVSLPIVDAPLDARA